MHYLFYFILVYLHYIVTAADLSLRSQTEFCMFFAFALKFYIERLLSLGGGTGRGYM